MSDTPKHYEGDGDITCADAMESMMVPPVDGYGLSPMGYYWWGCALKYVWRWPHKGGKKDIEKAIDCLTRLLPEEGGVEIPHPEPRASIQCTECVHCRVGEATMFCDAFEDKRCSEARGTSVCVLSAEYVRK